MSREKRHTKKNGTSKINADENRDDRSKSQLFTEADAKSVELSGYALGRGAPYTDRWINEHAIPTGVVGVDESVQLPSPSSKYNQQHHVSNPYTTLRPRENYDNEYFHLPPISQYPPYPHPKYLPEYYPSSPYYYNFEHLSRPYPNSHDHYSSHHHHRHRKHRREVETYDPRWWYLPLNSVHAPKIWRPPAYHYTPSKWYESTSRQSRTSMNAQEFQPPPQKHIDCRCEVCRPSKESPRGTRWVVNE